MRKLIVFILCLMLAGSASAALEAWYEFDADFSDTMGNHDGVPNGGVGIAPSGGVWGGAMTIDGAVGSYVVTTGWDLPTTITVAGWMHEESFADHPQDWYAPMVAVDAAWPFPLYLGPYGYTTNYGGPPNVVHAIHNDTPWPGAIGGALIEGAWNHLAMTDDGVTVKCFLNGVEVGSGPSTEGAPNLTADILIGGWMQMAAYGCGSRDGLIDDVRIYSHALTAEEVEALIPEPATLALLGLGGLLLRRKRA